MQVSWHNPEDRAHPLTEHLHLLVQIDYVKFDRDARTIRPHSEIKPGSIVILELRAMAVVLRPQVEFIVQRVFEVRAVGRFAFDLINI